MTGFLLINKPRGLTSYNCVDHIKKIIKGDIKVGHAGTLDLFASGLLIIGIGYEATRHLGMDLDKQYIAKGKLGVLTDTLDKSGIMVNTCSTSCADEESLRNAIKDFGKGYMQSPPVYSAIKHQGEPLYKLAREGKYPMKELLSIVQGKKKNVRLYNVELISCEGPFFTIKAHVSHGTYIRSLINDIAKHQFCKCVATTFELTRTQIGPFTLKNTLVLDEIKTVDYIEKNLLSIDTFLDKIHSYEKPE